MGRGTRGSAGEREEYDGIMYWMDGWEGVEGDSLWARGRGRNNVFNGWESEGYGNGKRSEGNGKRSEGKR